MILRFFDPALLEICYADTDSLLVSCTSDDLEVLMKPEFKHRFAEVVEFLFGVHSDETCTKHRAGKLKVEG